MYARSYFGGLLVGDQLIRNSIQTTIKNWHTKENFFSSITFIPNHTNGKQINDFMLHIDKVMSLRRMFLTLRHSNRL